MAKVRIFTTVGFALDLEIPEGDWRCSGNVLYLGEQKFHVPVGVHWFRCWVKESSP